MNIAIFSDSYNPSLDGVVTQINNIKREFLAAGHRVLIVAPAHSQKWVERENNNLKELLLPSIALPTYKAYRIATIHSGRVLKALKDFEPDVVHNQTPFSIGWQGLRYGKKLNVPVIGTYHTLLPEFLMYLPIPFLKKSGIAKMLTWKYTALFYNSCDLATTPTKKMKEELEKNGIKNVTVLSNAIDFENFNSAAKKKKFSGQHRKIKLIYFGRVSFEKNIEVILSALRLLLAKKMDVSLTITGDGPALAFLKKMANESGIAGSVEFTGKLTGNKLVQEVAAHDALVSASTIETQGLTILEAMAAGIPCIGTDFMAISDTIRDGKNGLLFRPFDAQDLAQKVEKFAGSAALRKRLGANAINTAQKYSAQKIAKETERLYLKVRTSGPK